MKTTKKWYYEIVGKKVVEKLKANNFKAEYVDSKEEALQKTLDLIDNSKTIGVAGSMTIRELGIIDKIKENKKDILDATLPGYTPEENIIIRQKQFSCDCFLCSSNAITMDGELVNTDSTGNRVGAMAFGPRKVVIVAGVNKIVKDIESAESKLNDEKLKEKRDDKKIDTLVNTIKTLSEKKDNEVSDMSRLSDDLDIIKQKEARLLADMDAKDIFIENLEKEIKVLEEKNKKT